MGVSDGECLGQIEEALLLAGKFACRSFSRPRDTPVFLIHFPYFRCSFPNGMCSMSWSCAKEIFVRGRMFGLHMTGVIPGASHVS